MPGVYRTFPNPVLSRARRRARSRRLVYTGIGSGVLTAGTASFVTSGPAVINVIATDATLGTGPYTYQWQRNSNGGSFSDLAGKTSLSLSDTTASPGTLYGYRMVYTDSFFATATSNTVSAQAYTGGALTGGASPIFSSSLISGVL